MNISRIFGNAAALALLGMAIAACESTRDIEAARPDPAPVAPAAPENRQAPPERVAGVRVLTQTTPWPGRDAIEKKVTPIQVRIENGGRIPIDVRYRDLSLLGPDGRRYNAVPPYRIVPGENRPVVDVTQGPVEDPEFTHDGFRIAPYYSPAYPGMQIWENVFVFDPRYYENAYRYWEDTELPTREMLRHALPEGVVNSGGNVEGWVYFEKLPEGADDFVLRTDLVNSRTGVEFAEVRSPYRGH